MFERNLLSASFCQLFFNIIIKMKCVKYVSTQERIT